MIKKNIQYILIKLRRIREGQLDELQSFYPLCHLDLSYVHILWLLGYFKILS